MSSSLLLSERLSDVLLKVRHSDGYTWRFPAHSLLLRRHCPHLARQLDERERDGEGPVSLTVLDVAPRHMLHMLRYIYEGHVPENPEVGLLLAAERYGLRALHCRLEEGLLSRRPFPVAEACGALEQLRADGPRSATCPLAVFCEKLILRHALIVFCSDLVLGMERATLERLLESDSLNVPDEALVFWGVWRWGRRGLARLGRGLEEEEVLGHVDSLLTLVRSPSVRRRDGIPQAALDRFDRCRCRRRPYAPPEDSPEQCRSLALAPGGWRKVVEGEDDGGALCVQVSCDRHAFLVGAEVDLCREKPTDTHLCVLRETDGLELRRERVQWNDVVDRKLTRIDDSPSEQWLEGSSIFSRPLLLGPGVPYSLYLRGPGAHAGAVPEAPAGPRRRSTEDGKLVITVHSPKVRALRALHLLTDVEVTWGPHAPGP